MKKIILFILLGFIAFIGFHLFLSAPEIKNTNPSGENIICFGDSLTYGTGATKKGMDYHHFGSAQVPSVDSKHIFQYIFRPLVKHPALPHGASSDLLTF